MADSRVGESKWITAGKLIELLTLTGRLRSGTFVRFKNPAQESRYASVVHVIPGSLTPTEHFTHGVESGNNNNKDPEVEENGVHPRIVSLKKNRGHKPCPKDDSHYPQTFFTTRHVLVCIVAG